MRALISTWDKTGARRVRARPRLARLAARREREHRGRARGDRPAGGAGRGRHGLAGDARRPREDAPPARPRGHPRPARRGGGRRHARGARDRGVRPRLRQPLSVRGGHRAARGHGGGGRRDDRHRRPVDAARRREELRPLRAGLPARAVPRRARGAARRAASSRSTRAARLAAEAFAHTAAYEAAIATWFNAREEFPDSLVVSLDKVLDLAYGENPHQRAAYYAERGARRHLLSRVEQLHGKELSFNNLNDFSAARSLAREFALPACVIVKHANPCGVAVGTTDRGGVRQGARLRPDLGLRRRRRPQPRGRGAARREARGAVRRGAVRARLHRGRARRAAAQEEHAHPRSTASGAPATPGERTTSACSAGCSSRTPTPRSRSATAGSSSPASSSEPQWGDLVFAWRVCKHVASNAIVLVEGPADDRDRRRPDEPRRRGADRGREGGRVRPRPRPASALASDAFFPFPDGPQIALDAGMTAIVQPGGSTPRRGRDRRGRRGGRRDGLHRAPPLPPLGAATSYLRGGRISTVECFVVFPPVPVCSVRVRLNRKPPLARSRPGPPS